MGGGSGGGGPGGGAPDVDPAAGRDFARFATGGPGRAAAPVDPAGARVGREAAEDEGAFLDGRDRAGAPSGPTDAGVGIAPSSGGGAAAGVRCAAPRWKGSFPRTRLLPIAQLLTEAAASRVPKRGRKPSIVRARAPSATHE